MATEAALAFGADAERAVGAGLGFVLLGVPATVAGVMVAQVGFADAAVHAAWGDEGLGDGVFHPYG